MSANLLADQVAIVTGAGRGIGRAVVTALAAEGAAVVLAARTRAELAAAASDIRETGNRTLIVPTDITQEQAVFALMDQAVAEFGRVDVLVNAAGVASFSPVAAAKIDDWDAMHAVNLRGVMLCCQAVLPVMMRQQRGTIINIGSVAATRPIAGAAAYAATKAGVLAFSRVLAEELRPSSVRVSVVMPGAVDTPLWDAISAGPDRARMLRPADVARTVLLAATLPPGASLEELTVLPAGGVL
jgi:NADP-dependent 3-hydroxy acid dehydrogenase YdfG